MYTISLHMHNCACSSNTTLIFATSWTCNIFLWCLTYLEYVEHIQCAKCLIFFLNLDIHQIGLCMPKISNGVSNYSHSSIIIFLMLLLQITKSGEKIGLKHFKPIKPLGCGDTGRYWDLLNNPFLARGLSELVAAGKRLSTWLHQYKAKWMDVNSHSIPL